MNTNKDYMEDVNKHFYNCDIFNTLQDRHIKEGDDCEVAICVISFD